MFINDEVKTICIICIICIIHFIIHTNNIHFLQADGLPRASLMHDLQKFEIVYNRGSVVNWMVGAAFSIGISNSALFHAVQLLDRSGITISCKKLLPAMAALWLASKYENLFHPSSSLIMQLSHTQSYSKDELHKQEVKILTAVGHRLSLPTVKTFLCFYMSRMLYCKKFYFCTSYLAELSLLDTLMLSYLPSQVAASLYVWGMVLVSKCCMIKDIVLVTGYEMSVITPIIRRIAYLHQAASRCDKPSIISMKYMDQEFGCVAIITPLTDKEIEMVIISMKS
jgi:hypothetical protein